LVEGLWISVIKKSRVLGLSLDKMAKAKPYFFESIYPNSPYAFVDYYTIGAICMKRPAFFVILPDGQSEFLFYEELTAALTLKMFDAHVSILLNPLLDRLIPNKYLEWKFPLERPVSVEQAKICDILDREDFDSLQIVKKKGEMKEVKIEKTFPASFKEHDLKEGYQHVSIENHHDDGFVKARKRTIHQNF
jgi:hypothetical protein